MSEATSSSTNDREENSLITERDIDEDSGLFQEGSFPGALEDKKQEAAIHHALPQDNTLDTNNAGSTGDKNVL